MSGDICGYVYEFHPIRKKDFPLLSEKSCFTDDTVMTIAVAEALMDAYGKGEKRYKKSLVQHMQKPGRQYPYAGYGGMFQKWLKSEHPQPYHSFGNASAMRVSPVGWLCSSLEETRQYATWSAEVTHDHPEGIKGAQAIASAIYLARCRADKDAILMYEQRYYDLDQTLDEIRPSYHFDETCRGSVPQAIRAFYEGRDDEDVIRLAIRLGADSDTLACMACGIAEAYYGMHLSNAAVISRQKTSICWYCRRIRDCAMAKKRKKRFISLCTAAVNRWGSG